MKAAAWSALLISIRMRLIQELFHHVREELKLTDLFEAVSNAAASVAVKVADSTVAFEV